MTNTITLAEPLLAAKRDAHLAPCRVAVVIVNYRTPDLVVDCLESLVDEIDPARDQVIVVDNKSDDGSAEAIARTVDGRDWHDWCRVIFGDSNNGFSAGNNVGLEAVDADYYWLTNSDTLFRPGSFARLLAAAEEYGQAGLLAPRLEWPNGEPQISCFNYASPLSELIDAAGTGPITKLLGRFDVPQKIVDESATYDWVSFASVLVRRDAARQVGLMDDGFFMYYEDVDYARRIKRAGWEVRCCPESRVVHLRGGSSPVKSLTAARKPRPRYYYAARARYFAKYYGMVGLWTANMLWTAGHLVARTRELVGNKSPHHCQRQWRDIWTNALRPKTGARK